MKVLVLGAGGMLGMQMVRCAEGYQCEVITKTHHDLDITDFGAVQQSLVDNKPEMIINCAGIVTGRSDVSTERMFAVNGTVPIQISALCDELNIKFVQVSTDCVFNGDKMHFESDVPNALDYYGRSKIQGEPAPDHSKHLIVRCSFVGIGAHGLLSWLFQQKGDVPGYAGVKWNGMTTKYVAQNILDLAMKDISGIVHIFGEDLTKFDILKMANEVFDLGLNIYPMKEPVGDFRLGTNRPYQHYTPSFRTQLEEMRSEYQVP